MEFVDSRSEIIVSELNKVELRKQDFKEINQLTDMVMMPMLHESKIHIQFGYF